MAANSWNPKMRVPGEARLKSVLLATANIGTCIQAVGEGMRFKIDWFVNN